jgi:hypothetical protein
MAKINQKQLGLLTVDAGDVVVFSADQVLRLMKKLGLHHSDYEDFIEDTGAIECEFNVDTIYAVDRVTALDKNGEEYNAVLIGAPEGCVGLKTQSRVKRTRRNHA